MTPRVRLVVDPYRTLPLVLDVVTTPYPMASTPACPPLIAVLKRMVSSNGSLPIAQTCKSRSIPLGIWCQGTCPAYFEPNCRDAQNAYTYCPTHYEKKTNDEWVNGFCYGAYKRDCGDFVGCRYGNCHDGDILDVTFSSSCGGYGFCSVDHHCLGAGALHCALFLRLLFPSPLLREDPSSSGGRAHAQAASNVASTVENITSSVANVTDIVSALQGGDEEEEQTSVVIVAVGSDPGNYSG
jgi:hypothetical protein